MVSSRVTSPTTSPCHTPLTASSAPHSVAPSPAIIACLCFATCSTALTLANKSVFSSQELNSPWTLLCCQSIAVTVILSIYLFFSAGAIFKLRLVQQMIVPCTLFTAYIFSNSQALRKISLPILSVIKSLAPMGIAIAERIVFRDRITTGTAAAMMLIVLGNTVTVFNDLEFSAHGYVWAIINVVTNIAYVFSLRFFLSDEYTPVEKAVHSNLIASLIMLPLVFLSGEVNTSINVYASTSTPFQVIFLLSCLLCSVIGASVFWVVQTTSGSTLSFVGACNKFVVVILGGLLFRANITAVGWISVLFGVLAGLIFAVSKSNYRGKAFEVEEIAIKSAVLEEDGYTSDDDNDNGDDDNVNKGLLRPN